MLETGSNDVRSLPNPIFGFQLTPGEPCVMGVGTGRRADGSGTTAQGLATGGETPSSPTSNATEEFTPETSSANVKIFSTS